MRWTYTQDGIVELELRQEPCNEIGLEALQSLEALVAELKTEPPKALIMYSSLTSGFCAGADLRQLYQEIGQRTETQARQELGQFINRIHQVFNFLDLADFPTIAVVHGVCFGGGFELALTADMIVAENSARFCFPELRLGIIPGFGGIPRLKRDIGSAIIRDLLFTGRSIQAQRAHAMGLVSQVAGDHKGLIIARKLAVQMTKYGLPVTAKAKAFIKALPKQELELEQRLFVDMFFENKTVEALKKFISSTDIRPYVA